MSAAFAGESHAALDAEQAAELLEGLVGGGDTVLVKGSRGVGLERVTERLRGVLPAAAGAGRGRR
jgi:UDP-N-acetylmuramyl pentapeptide synthase